MPGDKQVKYCTGKLKSLVLLRLPPTASYFIGSSQDCTGRLLLLV